MSAAIRIELNDKLYVRDPEGTELGKTIIKESIQLIDDLGFEHFTFKKLAVRIHSTEASVYRYFENKHRLLLYLVAWYWNWTDYQISYHTNNVTEPSEKLRIFIRIIANSQTVDLLTTHIDADALARIVTMEASKAYLTKEVDNDNKEGFFRDFKALCHKMAGIVLEVNPGYPFPHALISTLFETARKHRFFSQHLPSLTEVNLVVSGDNSLISFLEHIAFSAIHSSEIASTDTL